MTKLFPLNSPLPAPPKVVVVVGPTAAGKTALSIEIARAVRGEAISADSRQVYRELDIGTGKITRREMQGIPHHLIDVADPKKTFTAADYVHLGRAAISLIAARGHVPIVVGGTGFYVDALLGRVQLAEVPANKALRAKLETWSEKRLTKELKKLDPEKAKTIDMKNRVRLVRAIEIAKALGKTPPLSRRRLDRGGGPYEILWIGLTLPKEELAKKIHIRLFARIRDIEREVKKLHKKGLSWRRMEALGLEYRYMARYLQGKISQDEMLRELESQIRKYAKRQMTWFKRNKEIQWFTPTEKKKIISLSKKFLATNTLR